MKQDEFVENENKLKGGSKMARPRKEVQKEPEVNSKKEVPLEKRVYDNLKQKVGYWFEEIQDQLNDLESDLLSNGERTDFNREEIVKLKKRVAWLESVSPPAAATQRMVYSRLTDRLDKLEKELAKHVVEAVCSRNSLSIPKHINPQHREAYNQIKAASDAGRTKYLADAAVAEEYFANPVNHMARWTSDEDERLERGLISLVEQAARVHKRKKSAIMFRIAYLLKNAGVEL